jgi:hypothetical protein
LFIGDCLIFFFLSVLGIKFRSLHPKLLLQLLKDNCARYRIPG